MPRSLFFNNNFLKPFNFPLFPFNSNNTFGDNLPFKFDNTIILNKINSNQQEILSQMINKNDILNKLNDNMEQNHHEILKHFEDLNELDNKIKNLENEIIKNNDREFNKLLCFILGLIFGYILSCCQDKIYYNLHYISGFVWLLLFSILIIYYSQKYICQRLLNYLIFKK